MYSTVRRCLVRCIPSLSLACARPNGDRPTPLAAPCADSRGIKHDRPLRSLRFMFALIAAASLSACALLRANASWVDDLEDPDAQIVAVTIVGWVANRIAPGEKPILLELSAMAQNDRLTPELKSQLEAQGYSLAAEDARASDMHRLRILITAYSSGYVLRVSLDDAEASTMLSRGRDGRLVAHMPLAVREAGR